MKINYFLRLIIYKSMLTFRFRKTLKEKKILNNFYTLVSFFIRIYLCALKAKWKIRYFTERPGIFHNALSSRAIQVLNIYIGNSQTFCSIPDSYSDQCKIKRKLCVDNRPNSFFFFFSFSNILQFTIHNYEVVVHYVKCLAVDLYNFKAVIQNV